MKTTDKGLHLRNPHNAPYNFKELIEAKPELQAFVHLNAYDTLSIDFSNPQAVLLLNKALLSHFYKIHNYDIPKGSLCPPIPGRADYLHYMADVISDGNDIVKGKEIKVLDIGTGANLIYPLIGASVYGWSFVGVDSEEKALSSARNILSKNPYFQDLIQCRLQENCENILFGALRKDDYFDFSLCNPPFHKSYKEATSGTVRKNKNLGKKDLKHLNFEGEANELWYPGGEIAFISKMIKQSVQRSKNCLWFSSLVSKKDNLAVIYKILKQVKAFEVKTIDMKQGQKLTRIVAWTFLDKPAQAKWADKRN